MSYIDPKRFSATNAITAPSRTRRPPVLRRESGSVEFDTAASEYEHELIRYERRSGRDRRANQGRLLMESRSGDDRRRAHKRKGSRINIKV